MARNQGRHRIARRTKIATAVLGLSIAVGGLVVSTTTGDPGSASADEVDKSQFVDITKVRPNVDKPEPGRNASTGSFTVDCGKNENGHFNPDNFIAQPGIRNGAQHLHDYVGNLSTNADSNNNSLLGAGTTCANGDESAYFWPVVRIDTEEEGEQSQGGQKQQNQNQQQGGRDQQRQADRDSGGGGQQPQGDRDQNRDGDRNRQQDRNGRQDQQNQQDNGQQNNNQNQGDDNQGQAQLEEPNADNELAGNDGEIQRPAVVDITFKGNAQEKVKEMPKFLRILYGDAKVTANGPANARESWTCTGFEDRVIKQYPICPAGSDVKRVHTFPSCLDGDNIDSENHRDHIKYPNENGECANGLTAVPELTISLTYKIPREIQVAGQYKVDSFPEEDHNPFSDHDDFANVMSDQIMDRLVDCVNEGRKCRE
ncbi:hypothetical protein SD37_13620 [Amycolatopsis orientalis]|uniref:DUF1996 domain-containing protein n=1 Tax=Amycolatopsis orientalis TaxID=31958 RepID=A0A193BWQ2_AMYOR|nr:DUF1996 domain-containing protein [Amycolatopsis orientalis]ANN16594.1 hypothetical protein SD37_13620 [Amycolatopsis orientalis]